MKNLKLSYYTEGNRYLARTQTQNKLSIVKNKTIVKSTFLH